MGYTGDAPSDRITYQGYANLGVAGEVMVGNDGTSEKTGRGATDVRRMLSVPLFFAILTSGYRDLGLSIRSNTDVELSNSAVISVVNLAYKQNSGVQRQSSSSILTYPCDNTTGVNYRLSGDFPNPVPGRNLDAYPLGHPVFIRVRKGNTLSITDATMRNLTTNELVTLRSAATTKADDTAGIFKYNEAYVIPDLIHHKAQGAHALSLSARNVPPSHSRRPTCPATASNSRPGCR